MMRMAFLALSAALSTACSSEHGASGELEAPMLMEVMPMEGVLHLTWMNMTADAESVEAERKMDAGEFEPAFSVPGTVDNKMDPQATDDMDYTYRLRAKKGANFSPYSNEITGNPQASD